MPSPSSWSPSLGDLEEVRDASADTVRTTPVFSFGELSRRCGGTIAIKAENLQRTGSFKLRGAFAKLRGLDPVELRGRRRRQRRKPRPVARLRRPRPAASPARCSCPRMRRSPRWTRSRPSGRSCGTRAARSTSASAPPGARGARGAAVRAPLRRPRGRQRPGRRRAGAARAGPRPRVGDRAGRWRRVDQRRRGGAPVGRSKARIVGVQAAGCASVPGLPARRPPGRRRRGHHDRRRHRGQAARRGDVAVGAALGRRDGRRR